MFCTVWLEYNLDDVTCLTWIMMVVVLEINLLMKTILMPSCDLFWTVFKGITLRKITLNVTTVTIATDRPIGGATAP